MTEPAQGWWWPANSKKRHFMYAGRSLCGKWGMFCHQEIEPHEPSSEIRENDCAACYKKLKAGKVKP